MTSLGILVNAGVSFSLEGCLSHIVAAISTALSQDISVELDDFIGILPQARQADHDGLCSPQRVIRSSTLVFFSLLYSCF